MDDYSITSLVESKNEWCARLESTLNGPIIQGIKSIFNEALKLCLETDEENKYLMTFQNLLSQIPQWNSVTIEEERKRIEKVSKCNYLEELITCVHIIQLKALTCIRVGQKQKKIDIDIPSIDKFVHQIYINVARKLYTNIYLFEKEIFPLQVQKNNRELEIIVKESILITIRNNVPVEQILRVYMEETEEEEEVNIAPKPEPEKNKDITDKDVQNKDVQNKDVTDNKDVINKESTDKVESVKSTDSKLEELAQAIANKETTNKIETEDFSIDFSDTDNIIDSAGNQEVVNAPKDLDTLEKIAAINNERRSNENDEDDDDNENIKLDIGEDIKLDIDTLNISTPISLDNDPILDDIELL
jgi:hypothetical protein